MKYTFTILLICICFFLQAQKIYKYSAVDKAILSQANKRFVNIEALSDRQSYDLGLVYEKLYNRYKDTCMKKAVICYEKACLEENDYSFTSLQKTIAYKLGQIYEKGNGIKADTIMAMSWYALSTNIGVSRYVYLEKYFCSQALYYAPLYSDQRFYDSAAMHKSFFQKDDGMSIPVFTGCRYTSAQWSKVASPIAKFLRDRPDLVVQFSASGSSSWNSTFILKVQHDVAANQERLATYLIEKEGFGKERIRTDFSNNYDHARKGVSLIHFRFLSHAEAFAAAPKKKLRGLYVHKDDNGHCSSSIRLLRDGKYYIESGCEDRSSISFGQYEATEDELWLTPASNTEPAYDIVITDTTTNYGFIRLIDKDGLALSAFSLRTLTPGYLDTMRDSQVQYPDSNGYFILPSRGDINFTFNRNIKDIEVSPVFSQWKELKNTGSKVYTLRFNYPLSSLGYSYIQNLFGYELKYTYDYRKLVSRDGRIFLHQEQK